ncbi:MAG: hypothetical protein K8J31_06705 [Anaerolineae bacterium]|nr:hypothetical protein [Anaerolineae bacterium]
MSDIWDRIENDETGNPIPIANDPDGTPVFLSREVWQNHILVRHPEMANFKDLIVKAIAEPDKREIEDQDKHVIRCYADVPVERQRTPSRLRVRVVVKYIQPPERDYERAGLVSSAYLVRWKVD